MNSGIEGLPDDVLINEFLPTLDLKQLGSLCQSDLRIRSLCNNDLMWKNRVRREYRDAMQEKWIEKNWRDYYRYLLNTVSIPTLVEDEYIGNVRIDPKNLMPTVNRLIQRLEFRPDETISFIFLKGSFPISIYYYPEGDLIKADATTSRNISNIPDRLYIREGKITIGNIYTNPDRYLYPYIYIQSHPKGTLVIGNNPPKTCQGYDRYTLLDAMYQLEIKSPTEVSEANLLSLFPGRVQGMLAKESEEKLRYYAGWRKYTITQLCEILTKYLEKTGRLF